ncbi:MAG: hypothetical protein GVY25_05215 [Bacteroidetes bacterium]|jgi:hypothetical protein|nr:hypothetical protein [Bacteroidota bacterium]
MINSSLFRASLFYAGFLTLMAVVGVLAAPTASPVFLGSLLVTGVLVAVFGYGAETGQVVAQIALVLLGLSPLLSSGIQAAETGLDAWTTPGLLIRGISAVGGLVLSGLAVIWMLNDNDGSRNIAPSA